MAVDRTGYLNDVLESHRMSHIDNLVKKHKDKRNEIKDALEQHYTTSLYSLFNSGSFGKHTAINTKFDLDLVAPFKKNSFDTIDQMYNEVFDFLYEKYHKTDKAEVRKQRVSIGVLFYKDKDNHEVNIDVVPGREITEESYLEQRDLNIYFNENAWGFGKGTYTKTNIHSQIDHIKAKEDARKIIRLLKIWKNTNQEKYKSFLLELLTIKAFDKSIISGSLYEKLKAVMTFIRNNVIKDDFTLRDPGNASNDVIKTLETWERQRLSDKMKIMISRIDENSDNIRSYFPLNNDFHQDTENAYGLKGTLPGPSIPSNNQRFGLE